MVRRIGIHFKIDSMKKKNMLLGIIVGLTTIICSCQSELNDAVQDVSSIETPTNAVKKYVDENTYIDLDVVSLAKEIASPSTRATIDLDKVARMKAAIYRFYSNVELIDGLYNCKLTSASEINVSLDVYTALLNNLNEINLAIQKTKEKGHFINVPDVNEEYLNSLLE